MTTSKMKAMMASGYGAAEVYQLKEVDKPKPGANEILVKVKASSVTTADTMMRTGKPFITRLFVGLMKPKHPIPGTGFAGIVEDAGVNVTGFKAGDKVFGETTLGFSANAEYLTISENGVVLPMPDSLDYSEAANFCDGHLTSYNFLREIAAIKSGQHVLINGASGALGTAAVQIAKYYGAHVTAVCSGKNVGLVKSLGADEVIDYTREDFTSVEKKFDFVYDTVGKSSFPACKNILTDKGVYMSPVLKLSILWQMIITSLTKKKKARFDATGARPDEQLRDMLAEVLEIYKEGRLKTIIDRQFPLEKLVEAHRYIDAGHKKGNVVIVTI